MSDKDLRTALLAQPVPDEHIAEERTWETVRSAYLAREPMARRRRVPWRLLLLLALVGAGVAIALTPPGPAVSDWVRDRVGREQAVPVEPAKPAVLSLPAPGRLLVTSAEGVWIVGEDGSRRLLGAYDGAVWSPGGLFVAAWRGRELAALDPEEADFVHWTLTRDEIEVARWSSSGFRVAYLSGGSLRVVVGNGTGDRELAAQVSPVAPAWRPGREEVVAYADATGRVVVVDTDTGKVSWRTAQALAPLALAWTDDAERLAVLGERQVRVFQAPKKRLATIRLPAGAVGSAIATRPGSHDLAYTIFSPGTGESAVYLLDARRSRTRLVFAGAGRLDALTWSPDGALLLVGWPAADEWLFVPADGRARVTAVANVARELDPGGTGTASAPRVEGWCCPAEPG